MDLYQAMLDALNKTTDADIDRALRDMRHYGVSYRMIHEDGTVTRIAPEDVSHPLAHEAQMAMDAG